MRAAAFALCASALAGCGVASGEPTKDDGRRTFPAGSGVVDVRARYGARGDGVADDTAAIQKAIHDCHGRNRIVYLREGTYLVSDTLRWFDKGANRAKRTILQGEHAGRTVVKLRDRAPGYSDGATPKAVVWTGDAPAQRFRNSIRDLTFDTGSGNPGAVGVQFYANNQGSLRSVRVRSGDGAGKVGLDLASSGDNGPCLVKDVRVTGFEVGIAARGGQSVTLEHVRLEGQTRCGLENSHQRLFIRDLRTSGVETALTTAAMTVLLDSRLEAPAGGGGSPAIVCRGDMFVRNVETPGYRVALKSKRTEVAGSFIEEWTSRPAKSLFASPARSLGLPVRETPRVPWDDPAEWACPTSFGGKAGDSEDDTEAIQKAVDSGKTTVYLPNGVWTLDGTVRVRGNVRRMIGCEANVKGRGTLRVEDGAHPVVVIERLDLIYSDVAIEQATSRTLVLSSVTGGKRPFTFERGDLFLEDVCVGRLRFRGQKVWARQLNPEYGEEPAIVNDGGTLWLLGLKTEGSCTKLLATNGSLNEVFAYVLANKADNTKHPIFVCREGSLSATVTEYVLRRSPFSRIVEETRDGETRTLRHPGGHGGSSIPLFVGYARDE